jgi:transposase
VHHRRDRRRHVPVRHSAAPASWAGQCPGNDQSAGKRRSGKPRNGSKWLDVALEEAAMAAIRVKANYPAAQYRRSSPDEVTSAP